MTQITSAVTCAIRFPKLRLITGLSRCTIWRLENEGKFPRRIKLSANAVGWRSDEVQVWMEARNRGELAIQLKEGISHECK